MDDSPFAEKDPSAIAEGADVTAGDANPSPQSGGITGVTRPVWEKFVSNTVAQENNRAAVAAENDLIRQTNYDNRQAMKAPPAEIWKGAQGKLIHKVGRQSEMLDPTDYVDHPIAGGEARKSLWQRDVKDAKTVAQGYADQLADPVLKAKKMKQSDYDNALAEGSTLQETDPRHIELKKQIMDHNDYVAKEEDLKQKHWDASTHAHALEATDPDEWHAAKKVADINANRRQIIQGAQDQHAEADAAAASLAQDQSALQARMAQGVKGSELAGVQAQQAQHAQAQATIDAAKQTANAQIDTVKQAAAAGAEPQSPEKPPVPEGVMGTIFRNLATELPSAAGVVAGTMAGTGLGAALGIESGPGALATGVAGGIAGGAAVKKIQTALVGPDGTKQNELQRQANDLANPFSSQASNMAAMLVAFFTPGGMGTAIKDGTGKVLGRAATAAGAKALETAAASGTSSYAAQVLEHIVQGGAGFAKVEGAASAGRGDSPMQVADAMAKGAVEGGAMGFIPGGKELAQLGLFNTAKQVLTRAVGRGVADTVALTFAGDIYDAAVHGKEINYESVTKQLGGNVTPFFLQNLILGAFHAKWRPGANEQLLKGVNDHLTTIDPTLPPATADELQKAHQMFGGHADPAVAAKRYADGVLIHRQLKDIDAQDTQAVADAQSNLDAVKASGVDDKNAIPAAEAALETAKAGGGRSDLVRASMKIASGQDMTNLTDEELTQLGVKRGKGDNFPTPLSDEKLAANGLDKPLVYEGADGSPILKDDAIKRVAAISPDARAKISMDETQADAAARSRVESEKQLSTTAPNGGQGDPATGSQRVSPDETKGGVENPIVPEVPATADPAKEEAANPQHAATVNRALAHIAKIVAGKGRLGKAIEVSNDPKDRAVQNSGKITINPERLTKEALDNGMTPDQAHDHFKAVVDEEINHLAEHHAKVAIFNAAKGKGDPRSFKEWNNSHSKKLLDSDFEGEKGEKMRSVYTMTTDSQRSEWDAKTPAEKEEFKKEWAAKTDRERSSATSKELVSAQLANWDSMNDSQKLSESVRILMQERGKMGATERAKLVISEELKKYIQLVLHSLRTLAVGDGLTPEMASYMKTMEEAIKDITTHDSQRPEEKAAPEKSGNPPTPKAGPKPPPSEGAGPPAGAGQEAGGLKVGDRVEFNHPGAGGDAKGELVKLSPDGSNAIVSRNGVNFKVKADSIRALDTKPDTKPEGLSPNDKLIGPNRPDQPNRIVFERNDGSRYSVNNDTTIPDEAKNLDGKKIIIKGYDKVNDAGGFSVRELNGDELEKARKGNLDSDIKWSPKETIYELYDPTTGRVLAAKSSGDLAFGTDYTIAKPLADTPQTPTPQTNGRKEKASTQARKKGQVLNEPAAGEKSPVADTALSEGDKKMLDALDGLFTSELPKNPAEDFEQKIPPDRFEKLMGAAASWVKEGVDSPEKLAAKLGSVADGKLKPFSQRIWSALHAAGADGDTQPDWAGVYGKVDAPVEKSRSESAASPDESAAPKLTYDEFKKQYSEAFDSSNKYHPDKVGSRHYTDQMAALAEQYPEFEKQLEEEGSQPAVAPVTPPAPVAKAAKAQAKKPDTNVKKLKAQKEYLLAALDKAFGEAESTRLTPEQLDAIREIDENWISDPSEADEERSKEVRAQRAKAIEIFNGPLIPKIEIEVPGDGTFRIVNTKSAITDFREKAKKKFPTSTPKAADPKQASTSPTAITAIGTPKELGDFQKIAAIATTKDETRYALKAVHNDGENIVATDGRRALVITHKTIGSKEKPINLDPKTLKPLKDKDGDAVRFPNWRQVMPTDFKEEIPIDTAVVQKIVIQAAEMTSDGQMSVYLWRDASGNLGFISQSADIGMYAGGELDPDSATLLVALNNEFFNDGLTAMRRLGFDKVMMQYTDAMSAVVLVAPDVKYVLMPMRGEMDGSLHPLSKAAEEAEAARQAKREAAAENRKSAEAERAKREEDRIAKIVGEEERRSDEAAKAPTDLPEPSASPAAEALTKATIDMLLRSGHEAVPSGPRYSGFRQLLMEKLTGKKATKADSGVTKVTTELAKFLGVDVKGNIWGATDAIKEKLREMRDGVKEAEPAAPSQTAEPEKPSASETAAITESDKETEEGIKDFGEKIGGARKDLWGSFKKTISEDIPEDAADIVISKSFPEPHYASAIEQGIPVKSLATFKAIRDSIPAKPRKSWKMDDWVKIVRGIHPLMQKLAAGDELSSTEVDAIQKLFRGGGLLSEKIEFYKDLGFPAFTKADDWKILNHVSVFHDGKRKLDKPEKQTAALYKGRFVSDMYSKSDNDTGHVEVVDKIRARILKELEQPADKKANPVEFKLYQDRFTKELYIGKKAVNGVVRLKSGFSDVKEARQYLADNRTQLEEQWAGMKVKPDYRRQVNVARQGTTRREGDATPESFQDAFGFRGVEFGNWVEDSRRQVDLNEAFDAFMDLADAIGIPPKAVSLDGSLGLAFGARGHAGAAAHYEPGRVVINLTKKSGPGSLGHEWFHAFDNYFARLDKTGETKAKSMDSFATTNSGAPKNMRPEVWAAFKQIRAVLEKGPFADRSKKLDDTKSKPYYGTTIEKAARAFERYTVDRLATKDVSNDYLVNIVKGFDPALPTPEEMSGGITQAFDHLFNTLDTKETDKGVALHTSELPKREEKDPFYSKLERTVDEKIPNNASPAQIMATLLGSGVKAEEIKWSGIIPKLQELAVNGKVPKAAVLDYLRNEGAVKFHEVTLGNHPTLDAISKSLGFGGWHSTLTEEQKAQIEEKAKTYPHLGKKTKFGKYTLPGGENYKETVLAMPEVKSTEPALPENSEIVENDGEFKLVQNDASGKYIHDLSNWKKTRESVIQEFSHYEKLSESKKNNYTSSHFPDVPNYVAHMRTNERTDAAGKPGMFIEEKQSDRHQAGKKDGYQGDTSDAAVRATFGPFTDSEWQAIDPGIREDWRNEIAEGGSHLPKGIPDAPYRKDWYIALFKRALHDAVSSGKEWIGWTTGETQADRFDLSKQVDEIHSWPDGESKDGEPIWGIQVIKGRTSELEDTVKQSKLESLFGKDVANRIIQREGDVAKHDSEVRTLSGDDLKVGGEGMKWFYDQILLKEIGKYVKQWGAKVEQSNLSDNGNGEPESLEVFMRRTGYDLEQAHDSYMRDRVRVSSNDTPIWRVNITPEMKKGVEQGQALFTSELPKREETPPKLTADSPEWKAMSKDERMEYLRQREAAKVVGEVQSSELPKREEKTRLDQARELAAKTPGLDIVKGVADGFKSLLLPSWKSKGHLSAAETLGSKIGQMNRRQEGTNAEFSKDHLMFEKLGVHREDMADDKNPAFKFMSDMSTGRQMSPVMDGVAKRIEAINKTKIDLLKDAGAPLQSVRENYFPGVWTQESRNAFNLAMEEAQKAGILDKETSVNDATSEQKAWVKAKVAEFLKDGKGSDKDALAYLTKTPFKGKESFRKRKVFDQDIMTAIEFGLKPVSANPIDIMKLKWAEMDRNIMANKAMQSWAKEGKLKIARLSDKVPDGWQKVKDKYGEVWGPREIAVTSKNSRLIDMEGHEVSLEETGLDALPPEGTVLKVRIPGLLLTGHRIVPNAVGDVLNNYLSSSLYNNQYFGKLYTGWMGFSNALNQTQLGVGSFFHVGFTAFEVQTSANANVLKDVFGVIRGNRKVSDLGKSIGNAFVAIPETFRTGGKIMDAWKRPDGTVDPKIANVVRAAELAGGGFTMERGLQTDQVSKLVSDYHNGHELRAAMRSPIAAVEMMARPIMDHLVPRQKAGVFGHMANRIIEMNPGKSLEELTPEFRQAWNRIDARLGQVRYDRLFTNNTAKNFIQGMVRAPGWSGGTIAELGGSFKDVAKFFGDWHSTGKIPADMPDRVAYTASLLLTVGATNALLTYLFTGDQPKGMDYWAFRTGGVDEHGTAERMVLPSYMKDLLAYMKEPGTTLMNKSHPALSLVADLVRNKDYYGVEINHADDNVFKRIADEGKYVAKAFEPFWIRGVRKEIDREASPLRLALPQVGIMPAPKKMVQTEAEELAYTYAQQKLPVGSRTQEQADASREKYKIVEKIRKREPVNFGTAIKNGYITLKDIPKLRVRAAITPLAYMVKKLDIDQAEAVYRKASPAEKVQIKRIVMEKKARGKEFSPLKESD